MTDTAKLVQDYLARGGQIHRVNRLICIGYLGHMACYLNVSEKEARLRFSATFHGDEVADPDDFETKVIEFTDVFHVYDIWADE